MERWLRGQALCVYAPRHLADAEGGSQGERPGLLSPTQDRGVLTLSSRELRSLRVSSSRGSHAETCRRKMSRLDSDGHKHTEMHFQLPSADPNALILHVPSSLSPLPRWCGPGSSFSGKAQRPGTLRGPAFPPRQEARLPSCPCQRPCLDRESHDACQRRDPPQDPQGRCCQPAFCTWGVGHRSSHTHLQ